MASIVSQRFVQCHLRLKEEGKIKSSRQFALALQYHPQNLSEIMKGKRDVPLEVIRRAYDTFGINPMFLYTGKGDMFVDEEALATIHTVTLVEDQEGNELIVHVPTPAQAGYCHERVEASFFTDLPRYRLPGRTLQQERLRSFDVEGDSMHPNLHDGDIVVCHYVSPLQWNHSVVDDHVFVLVTRSGVMVKRVENHLERHRHLILYSDNPRYKPYRLNIGEILEIWKVASVISKFNHQQVNLPDLNETIKKQSALIMQLTDQIEKLAKTYDH